MSAFILVIFFQWKSVDHAEFTSKERCEAAKIQVAEAVSSKRIFGAEPDGTLRLVCVQK